MLVAESINSFGAMLKYLRRSARLTWLPWPRSTCPRWSWKVGTEAHICRLGKNMRPPDVATLAALFVPALELESRPELTGRLLQLASEARRAPPPPAWPLAVAPQAGGHHHPAPAPALRAGRSAAPDAAHWRGRVQLSRGADPGRPPRARARRHCRTFGAEPAPARAGRGGPALLSDRRRRSAARGCRAAVTGYQLYVVMAARLRLGLTNRLAPAALVRCLAGESGLTSPPGPLSSPSMERRGGGESDYLVGGRAIGPRVATSAMRSSVCSRSLSTCLLRRRRTISPRASISCCRI